MFRQSKFSAPYGRGKNGMKMSAGGAFTYDGANQDAVSPEKLQALIHTFEGDYPRIPIDRWGKSLSHDQSSMLPRRMASGGRMERIPGMQGNWNDLEPADKVVRKLHGDNSKYGKSSRIVDFFAAAGGLIERPYGISSHLFPDEMKMAKGGWIQGAVNPAHKGYCTPMSKSTCTGARRRFAMTMKKHHGFHEKAEGGLLDFGPGDGKPDVLNRKSARFMIDQKMAMNYPGIPVDELDRHNKPIKPGVPDTIAELSLRRGSEPSIQVYRPQAGQQAYAPTLDDFGTEDYNNTLFTAAQRLSANKRMGGRMGKFSKKSAYC